MDCYLAWFVVISLIYSAQGQSTSSINALQTANQAVKPHPTLPHPNTTQRIYTSNASITANQSAKPTPSPSGHKQVSSTAINTNSVNASSPYITRGMSSNIPSTITPNKTQSISTSVTSPVKPNTTTHVNPNMTTAHHNGTHVLPTGTMVSPIHSRSPAPGPTKSAGKGDDDYNNMKKRMWVAAAFAIIFALTTVILAYLVYRQRKINRELAGDPASSRLL